MFFYTKLCKSLIIIYNALRNVYDMLSSEVVLFLVQRKADELEGVSQEKHPVAELVREVEKYGISEEIADGFDDRGALVEEIGC